MESLEIRMELDYGDEGHEYFRKILKAIKSNCSKINSVILHTNTYFQYCTHPFELVQEYLPKISSCDFLLHIYEKIFTNPSPCNSLLPFIAIPNIYEKYLQIPSSQFPFTILPFTILPFLIFTKNI